MKLLLNIFMFGSVLLQYTTATKDYSVDIYTRAFRGQENIFHDREKRSIGGSGSLGLKAMAWILKGAVRDKSAANDPRKLVYVKKGDLYKAFKDFYSVGVKAIGLIPDEGIVKVGIIGDRTVIIGRKGNGEATVTIIKTKYVDNPNARKTVVHYNKNPKLHRD